MRLATGIQQEVGGDIYFIDTESRRALHYADKFKFKHIEFKAPYGSLDYLAALQFCVEQGAKVVIVDSKGRKTVTTTAPTFSPSTSFEFLQMQPGLFDNR